RFDYAFKSSFLDCLRICASKEPQSVKEESYPTLFGTNDSAFAPLRERLLGSLVIDSSKIRDTLDYIKLIGI
ncbi:hypothetical protein, partial [Phormidium sp. CCY1219]|uniref:hypothetical protein n=1 Tax=Phormidium sp. CCY1219 TaxID=2886104 RepID=UPI002D1E854F